ncbi:oligosaccharide flippase family protein [Megamonas rupellensis]|uniref:Polysaccharide biosynthesis protein n=1 Tax=Megamonas rupellensis TaxID=491921 RepID=A0A411ZMD5_9FIRM|nr:oligosaccharide flippase family protein [Megamonas rupellensis]RGQ04008.1 polysaccharide biosynthesis protein [Megamonas rupellensis]
MNERKYGIFLSYFNMIIYAITGFIYLPILLYYIGMNEYGIYQLIGSFIAYFSVMDFGLSSSVTRFYIKYKTLNDKINMENVLAIAVRAYSIIAIILLVLGCICYFNIDKIFSNSMTDNEIEIAKNLFLLLLFNMVITVTTMIFRAILVSYEKFLFIKGLETFQSILQPILVVLVLQEYPSAFSVALVQTGCNIFLILLRVYYCFNKLNIVIKYHYWNSKLIKEFKKLALSIFIVTLIDQVFFKTNQIILGIISGPSDVAVYAVAAQIYLNYMVLSQIIVSVYVPYVTELVTKKEPIKVLSQLFIRIGRWQYFLLGAICSGFFIFGKQFINIWAGKNFNDAYWITLIVIVPFTIDLIQNIGLSILQAQNKYDFRAKIYFCMGLLNLGLAIPLGYKYGGIGCAIATGLSMFIGNGIIMNWYYASEIKLDINIFWKNIFNITVAISLLTIIFYYINVLVITDSVSGFIIKLLIYMISYILVMYNFIMNIEEKEKVRSIFIKK